MSDDADTTRSPVTVPRGPASRQLLAVSRALRQPKLSVGEVVDLLGAEGLGLALLVLTLPSLIPIPGPFGMVFGTLVGLLALQILIGAERLWLPRRLRARPAPHKAIRTTIAKALPWIGRAEIVLREGRLKYLTGRHARIAFAAPILLMAVTLALPIPLGNLAPALALIAIGLGFLARDGLAVLIGLVASVGAIGWTAVLFVFGAEALAWAAGLFG
ncbi:MAG TPA: exopolysaccharide biosynthesis protein [Dongiaceae bacterium]|jgi:hypothetical protein|nr:exopolysaccharide biosynthesis protein [Dongiaceae bacterium]